MTGENRNTPKKTCPSASVSILYTISHRPGIETGLPGETPTTNRTASIIILNYYYYYYYYYYYREQGFSAMMVSNTARMSLWKQGKELGSEDSSTLRTKF